MIPTPLDERSALKGSYTIPTRMALVGIMLLALGIAIMVGAILFLVPHKENPATFGKLQKRPTSSLQSSPKLSIPHQPSENELWQKWYKEGYLLSSKWQEKRRSILMRAGYKCELCGSTDRLDVHHLTYERVRYERPDDLQALCRSCHDRQHSSKR